DMDAQAILHAEPVAVRLGRDDGAAERDQDGRENAAAAAECVHSGRVSTRSIEDAHLRCSFSRVPFRHVTDAGASLAGSRKLRDKMPLSRAIRRSLSNYG